MKNKNTQIIFYIFFILISSYFSKNTKVQLLSSDNEISQLTFQSNTTGYVIQNLNNGTATLLKDNSKIISFNSYDNLEVFNPLILNTPNLDLVMKYLDSSITYDDVDQWTMVKLDDFQGMAEGWSKDKLSTCGTNDNMFLGGHCNFGGEDVWKNFTELPNHNMLRITANFHFFDKWEGEEAFMFFDGIPVWSDSYKWCDKVFLWYCKKYAINACGAEYPDRLSVPIDFTTNHNKSSFLLNFGAFHNKSACDASWGIDDVTIYIK